MLPVDHLAHNGRKKILIRTVDTDVIVLAVALARTLDEEAELWVLDSSCNLRALGPEKAKALPMFHALTGCDTVSCFTGHGKRTAWEVWTLQLTQTLHCTGSY